MKDESSNKTKVLKLIVNKLKHYAFTPKGEINTLTLFKVSTRWHILLRRKNKNKNAFESKTRFVTFGMFSLRVKSATLRLLKGQ